MTTDIDTNSERARLSRDDVSSWDSLTQTYNFRTTFGFARAFTAFVIEECDAHDGEAVALDIGCGNGIGCNVGWTREIRSHVRELWGIEPDESIERPAEIDHFQHALMETAELPENHFDVIFSFTVMEHVEKPEEFMRAVERALKPGGVYIFMTPNGKHYFSIIGSLLKAIRLDEIILRMLRGATVDEYHYPVQYKFNSARQIEPICEQLGFEKPECVFIEREGPKPYFPGPLRPIWWLLMKKRDIVKKPELLLELFVKCRKK